MDWEAIQDLMDHSKLFQVRFPISGVELWIPIELMEKATNYAKDINLNVKLKDLSEWKDEGEK